MSSGLYELVLSNGRIMDPDSGLYIKGNVGIADGKIQYVGERALTGGGKRKRDMDT